MPCNPLSPVCLTFILAIGFATRTPSFISLTVPFRSVIRMDLSGRNAKAQGTSKPLAITIIFSGVFVYSF